MPVHQFVQDDTLQQKGLRNYWGYNTIGFFAPHNEYASNTTAGQHVQEFKGMVRALHEAGIEVILDVVYNHTAEGNHLGPTLSFKGIDNRTYYRLVEDDKQHYMDYTGTGNTLNVRTPQSLQLIMDSLRYWVTEMHVDGFRFDLASTLARELHAVDRLAAFFDLVHQDPVVSQVKLIAEPWDVGEGGYQVGNFPALWTEWNGKYRDTVRDFWRGEDATVGEFASRITGSSDLYQHSGRRPFASINFVTAHDGFTLNDLVSYNEKHNEANGEGNNDGESHNRSWNCGVEGPTDDPEILQLRAQQRRNFIATLMLSQGVPMLLHGDELGRTPERQQQRLLPGLRADLDRLGEHRRGPARVHQEGHQAAHRPPDVPPSAVLPRPPDPPRARRPGARHRLAHAVRRADDRRGLGRRLREVPGRLPQRPRHPEHGRARRGGRRRPLLPGVQRLARADRVHACPATTTPTRWTTVLDTAEMDEVEPVEVKPGEHRDGAGPGHRRAARSRGRGRGTVTEPISVPAASAAGRCRRPPTGCRSTPASAWRTPPRWRATWPTSG